MNQQDTWTIPGAEGEGILGATHLPDSASGATPAGAIIIVHGFLGYKDYGMFPALAAAFARAGWVCHRINLSHSGMTDQIETFARPDLFQRDTWNHQRTDVHAVIDAIGAGQLPGKGLPLVLFGHSRGGVTVIRTAAERFARAQAPTPAPLPAGIITLAAPDTCCSLSEADQQTMLDQGYLEVTSGRTGQTLRLGAQWLQEQRDDPAGHDVLRAASQITCPMLVAHGTVDPTVDPAAAQRLAQVAPDARLLMIESGDHVMNTPNPFPVDAEMSEQLQKLVAESLKFLSEIG